MTDRPGGKGLGRGRGRGRWLLDANVLYPTVMRAVLLGCAARGLFEPRWSARILAEWQAAAARLGPQGALQAGAELALLRRDWPEAEGEGGEEGAYWSPDPADAHVIAAAHAQGCDGIVTQNARDFPRGALADLGLARWDADHLAMRCADLDEEAVARVCEGVLADARAMDAGWQMRPLLRKARLPRLGKRLGG
ncbi:MAG: RSP_2648 family PIN domain-containing protein [Paracoccaceae bacterium]